MKIKTLPPGLEDDTLEIYRYNGAVNALFQGKKILYMELPQNIREPFQAELIGDKKAVKCLTDVMEITDPDDMEQQFVSCRYGNWDRTPDLENGKPIADAPNCEKEKDCPGFNILCKIPEGVNGKLTKQQYFIARLVGFGKLDKEIAHELGIEITTVRTHLANLREKLAMNNRIEIGRWAQQKGIV